MTTEHWSDELVELHACADAVALARTQPDRETAWANCERSDWMLWIAGKYAGPPGDELRKPLVLAACACAEAALPLIADKWVLGVATSAIQTAQAWAHGEAPLDDVRAAAAAAFASAYASAYASTSAAYASAYASASAAYASTSAYASASADADDAAYAAAYAAADAASAAADAASAADARFIALREMAEVVRSHYPHAPVRRERRAARGRPGGRALAPRARGHGPVRAEPRHRACGRGGRGAR